MSGNKTGAAKVRDKNLAKDPDYYKKLGKMAHNRGVGFARSHDHAVAAGTLGGLKSRRKSKVL